MMNVSRGPAPIPETPDIQAWRARALYLILIVLAISGLLAYGSTILDALVRRQMSPLLWVYAGVYVAFLIMAVIPSLSVPVRAWVVFILAYTNAAASFARVGLAGSGRLYLLFIPLAAVILVGSRAGWTCLAIGLGMYGIFGALAANNILIGWLTVPENPLSAGFWVEAGATLAVFLITMTVLIERFFANHLRTLEASRTVARELEHAYGALEHRVQVRTRELALLNSVAAVASGLVDLREILRIALRETMEAFAVEAGGAYGLEEETGTLTLLAHDG
ncbi:MAG TPA: hypothetical protein VL359_08295, partial [bacterium]|nr:hypothetical protein [bacterium]